MKWLAFHSDDLIYTKSLSRGPIFPPMGGFPPLERSFQVVIEISVNSVRNWDVGVGGVEVSLELLDLQKWFTYQNLQNFTRKQIEIFSVLYFNHEWFKTKGTKDIRDFMLILARPCFSAPPAFAHLEPCNIKTTYRIYSWIFCLQYKNGHVQISKFYLRNVWGNVRLILN